MSSIPTTDEAVIDLFRGRLTYPTTRTTELFPVVGPVYGLKIETPAWSYFLTKLKDGWELIPPNSSPRYVALVDQLIEVLLEVQHHEESL